jgi:hypothetical protein
MGKVVPFERPLPRPGLAKRRSIVAGNGRAWWVIGAAASIVTALLSPLRWPARIVLVSVGAIGIVGAASCLWLSAPTNWPMIGHALVAFLGSVAMWHGGEAVLKGSRTLSAYSFAKARQLHGEPQKAAATT